MSDKTYRPLDGVRVLDLSERFGGLAARYYADLGADVVRIVSPGAAAQSVDDTDLLKRLSSDSGKREIVLDSTTYEGLADLRRLIAQTEIVIDDHAPGHLDSLGLSPDALIDAYPALVVLTLTDFGYTGPYRDWIGTEQVHLALGGVLSRSGTPGIVPLMPPLVLASQCAAIQGLLAGLIAFFHRLEAGFGDHVDVSVYEAVAQMIDPGYGVGGGALGGKSPADGPRGRPDAKHLYPIFACRDGHVRICLLSARQWHGMRAWLGEPAEFSGPEYNLLFTRFEARDRLYPVIAAKCLDMTRDELVTVGELYAIPIGGVADLDGVLTQDHFVERGAVEDVALVDGRHVRIPTGFLEIDGLHTKLRPATRTESSIEGVLEQVGWEQNTARAISGAQAGPATTSAPLAGVRVLDLGVIIVGAEAGRVLADQGAEVIKIENRQYPDGARQSFLGESMSASFARGNRGKLSAGLNLRSEHGRRVFKRFVAKSDVILSNFKPGTLESLGLGLEALRQVNPAIVMVDSSAFGPSGPWSKRLGYGPLVRATSGITSAWRYADVEDSFSDAATAYPDHVSGRIGAAAALAGLIGAKLTGRGARISSSQAEVVLTQMTDVFVQRSLEFSEGEHEQRDAPTTIYACKGDDEWCVVDARGEEDWRRISVAIGRPEHLIGSAAEDFSARPSIQESLRLWMADQLPRDAMELLQLAQVPAAMMQRYTDMPADRHLCARSFFGVLHQPQLAEPLVVDMAPATFKRVSPPLVRPAPELGQHTRELCMRVLGMTVDEIDALLETGDLELVAASPTSVTT